MNSPVITSEPNETVVQISEKMAASKAGSIIVLQNDSPVGIVTEGDIVTKVVNRDIKPSTVAAKDIMSSPIHMIESEKEITEAARAMRKFGIKRLGVVYKTRLVGIISITDILAVTPELFDILSEKTLVLTGQATRVPTYLAGYCDVCNQWSDKLLELDSKFVCNECTSGDEDEADSGEDIGVESSEDNS